ncbi:MAG: hypothetical protein FD149_2255 [Rhodospirillaceae bacterium]|nr:MAG: hypothetical protein FD149_2255 [Rhodospirillaceae bacterium]
MHGSMNKTLRQALLASTALVAAGSLSLLALSGAWATDLTLTGPATWGTLVYNCIN